MCWERRHDAGRDFSNLRWCLGRVRNYQCPSLLCWEECKAKAKALAAVRHWYRSFVRSILICNDALGTIVDADRARGSFDYVPESSLD